MCVGELPLHFHILAAQKYSICPHPFSLFSSFFSSPHLHQHILCVFFLFPVCGQVVRISSQTGQGVPELWDTMLQFRDAMLSSGELRVRRQTQQKVWLWNLIQENAVRHFQQHPAVHAELPELERRVTSGDISPGLAADLLLKVFSTVQ